MRFSAFVISICLLTLFSCCKRIENTQKDRLLVVTSIVPLGDFIRQVGGERVDILVLVPPAANPHTFDLTPDLLIKANSAKLLVLNGAGLEFWADKLRENISTLHLKVIYTSKDIPLIGCDHDDHGHALGNPHVWLDPIYAMKAIQHIRDGLIAADSAHADYYFKNAQEYLDSLKTLDRYITNEVQSWSHNSFIAYHSSWIYFARRYGLDQVATLEKFPGHEISPNELTEIIRTMKNKNVRAIFGETQFSYKAVETLAKETSARVEVLDPIGSPNTSMSYLQLMHYNVSKMAAILR